VVIKITLNSNNKMETNTNTLSNSSKSKVVISNPVHGEVYSIQHDVIKFVSDLPQVGGFLLGIRFPLPIN